MEGIINLRDLADAKLDAQSLERFINGDVDAEVLTRLSQQYPSLQNFLFQFQKYNSRAYKTFVEMDADKANISLKTKVTVTNDATESNNGDWQWDGAVFTKSTYDPLTQAKAYTNNHVLGRELELTQPSQILGATAGLNSTPTQFEVLSNHINFTDGCYVGENGELFPYSTIRLSDYIPASVGASFTIKPSLIYIGAIYDKNLQFLEVILGEDEGSISTFTVINPATAFIRFNISIVDMNRVYANINKTALPWLSVTPDNIVDALETINNVDSSTNLLKDATFTNGGYIDNTNIVREYESYKYTNNFILIEPLSRYVISFASTFVGVFFDENYNFIGAIPSSTIEGTSNYEFSTPSDARYVKLNISITYDTIQSLKLKGYNLAVKPKSAWQNKTIAWYGTSIPAGYPYSNSDAERDIHSHANLAVHDLGGRIINKCVPAGGVSTGVALSFARASDAINYQNSLLNLIGTVDEPDLVVFDYGVNDYDQDPIDIDAFDPNDPYDLGNTGTKTKLDTREISTFIGGYNTIIDAMLTAKPDLKFCFITHFSNDNANPSIAKKQDNWKKLTQCQQALADYWSAPILNLHEKTGYRNRNNFDSITPVMPDHIHPASGDGRSVEQLRNIVRGFLISIA